MDAPVTTKPLKLELLDIIHLAVTVEPAGGAVIVGRGASTIAKAR